MARDGTKSGGRPKGSLSRKTLEAISILSEKGCDPLDILSDIAMGKKIKCGINLGDGNIEAEVIPTLDQRRDAAKELCQYVYPKRKAVEHSGSIGSHEDTLAALAEEDAE